MVLLVTLAPDDGERSSVMMQPTNQLHGAESFVKS